MTERNLVHVAAYAILRRDNKIFLLRRAGTGYMDGYYGLPSGHVEGDENPRMGAAREAREESGVDIKLQDLQFVHALYRRPPSTGRYYADYFFIADAWEGEPRNAEPDRCDEAGWFPIEDLPLNTIPYLLKVLELILRGEVYGEE